MSGPGNASGKGVVHSSVAHDSAIKHVTGQAIYVDDIPEPAGLLHVYFGRSRCAHGKILSMDLSRVESCPGVVAVLTASDIPGANDISPMHTQDEEILCSGEIHFCGQPLFAVAAESRDIARRAAGLAEIEIEELPSILTIEAAMEQQAWVAEPHEMRRGDIESGLQDSPIGSRVNCIPAARIISTWKVRLHWRFRRKTVTS